MTPEKNGRVHLNELSAKEWMKFTKSWFILDPAVNRNQIAAHPAAFPVELPTEFITFFTRPDQTVLDPFAGTGTTLLAAQRLGRQAHGIELEQAFVQFREMNQRITMRIGDSTTVLTDQEQYPDDTFDYLFTSPPYMNALRKSRGGNRDTRHKKRRAANQPLVYGDSLLDIGNIQDQGEYIERLTRTFREAHRSLKPGAYCTIVIQNLNSDGNLQPIAWRLALSMLDSGLWELKGEKIWCLDRRKLGIYGYPSAYATNNYHHYCLTFRKPRARNPG